MKGRTPPKPIALVEVAKPQPGVVMNNDKTLAKKKHGGKIEGKKVRNRADKLARGGSAKNWIQSASLKRGAFTKQAEKAGKSVREYAEEKKNAPGKTGKRARLALTFQKMTHKG